MTPGEFEHRYGVDAKRLRGYLRTRWPHYRYDRWELNVEMVADACARFGVGVSSPISKSSDRLPKAVPVQPARASERLQHQFLELAVAAGIPLVAGRAVPWLSSRGHLNADVQRKAPEHVTEALAQIHRRLGGDALLLANKSSGAGPVPDFLHTGLGCIVEIDEEQHFTTSRLATFELYPADVPLGFDRDEYIDLLGRWRTRGDKAFAHKTASDFPGTGGRQAQRAYNDALRDLLAPTFTGDPVIRIPVPDRSLGGAIDRLAAALAALG
jgi:hypothetical protein